MTPQERAEHAMSILMRLGTSVVLPIWALIMIGLGVEYRSLWWLGTGVVVGAIGVLFLAGSPITDRLFRDQ